MPFRPTCTVVVPTDQGLLSESFEDRELGSRINFGLARIRTPVFQQAATATPIEIDQLRCLTGGADRIQMYTTSVIPYNTYIFRGGCLRKTTLRPISVGVTSGDQKVAQTFAFRHA